ncbi:acyl-CoA dehydrogenase family protein [Metabacillus dongyingensis]|uniref:acyl-CoA dehydrogenase family protein n=1 Tax=Metabacillus dongyingensis TaxID=2874282 RepID=UPI003B8C0F30
MLDHQFIKTDRQLIFLEKAAELAQQFSVRADYYDQQALFPFENFNDLKRAGFLKLSIPQKYGGDDLTLYEFVLIQEKLAQGDGATALSLGWHLGILMNIRETEKWEEKTYARISREIIQFDKLLNSAASEPNGGSPARGGKPETTAKRNGEKWIINGKKIFTSLAPALDYFLITATIEDTGEVGEFIIPRESPGLSIEETWNTLGMRGTRSDDLILENVVLEADALTGLKTKSSKGPVPQGWLLHIPACYLGIAIAARNFAVQFAKKHQPNSLNHPIKDLPEVRRKIAKMDLSLLTARNLLYGTAEKWDVSPDERNKLSAELAAAKTVATNTAVEVVDLAMRVVGGQSMFNSLPLQRYYRDVRAGLHNPPADEITYSILADQAFQGEEQGK